MFKELLPKLIETCLTLHKNLCPRQILGLRIGLAGAACLSLEAQRTDKRLLAIVESDGCFADGVSIATGCTVGGRTLRVEDYGKVAAAFVDVQTGRALRLAPHLDVRQRAWRYAPGETDRYAAQIQAYQAMPDEELISIQEIQLTPPVHTLISRPGLRTTCNRCGEEIINEREIWIDGASLCRNCAGRSYYLHL